MDACLLYESMRITSPLLNFTYHGTSLNVDLLFCINGICFYSSLELVYLILVFVGLFLHLKLYIIKDI